MFSKTLVAVAVTLLTGACGASPRTAIIDTGFTADETARTVLDTTVSELEVASGAPFLSDNDSDFIVSISWGPLKYGTLGQAHSNGATCVITLNDSMKKYPNTAVIRHVIIHEIGHCFGLPHSESKTDIMYFQYLYTQTTAGAFATFVGDLNRSRGAW